MVYIVEWLIVSIAIYILDIRSNLSSITIHIFLVSKNREET